MPKLDKRLLTEVSETILDGRTALFLTPQHNSPATALTHAQALKARQEFADRVADRFRKVFIETAQEVRNCAELTARKLLRPEGTNPSFIRMVNRETGWVFFHPNEDITAGEELGTPAFVYWPSEGADYQKIPYLQWRRERQGSLWRPIHMKGSLDWEEAPPKVAGSPSRDGWAALFEDVF